MLKNSTSLSSEALNALERQQKRTGYELRKRRRKIAAKASVVVVDHLEGVDLEGAPEINSDAFAGEQELGGPGKEPVVEGSQQLTGKTLSRDSAVPYPEHNIFGVRSRSPRSSNNMQQVHHLDPPRTGRKDERSKEILTIDQNAKKLVKAMTKESIELLQRKSSFQEEMMSSSSSAVSDNEEVLRFLSGGIAESVMMSMKKNRSRNRQEGPGGNEEDEEPSSSRTPPKRGPSQIVTEALSPASCRRRSQRCATRSPGMRKIAESMIEHRNSTNTRTEGSLNLFRKGLTPTPSKKKKTKSTKSDHDQKGDHVLDKKNEETFEEINITTPSASGLGLSAALQEEDVQVVKQQGELLCRDRSTTSNASTSKKIKTGAVRNSAGVVVGRGPSASSSGSAKRKTTGDSEKNSANDDHLVLHWVSAEDLIDILFALICDPPATSRPSKSATGFFVINACAPGGGLQYSQDLEKILLYDKLKPDQNPEDTPGWRGEERGVLDDTGTSSGGEHYVEWSVCTTSTVSRAGEVDGGAGGWNSSASEHDDNDSPFSSELSSADDHLIWRKGRGSSGGAKSSSEGSSAVGAAAGRNSAAGHGFVRWSQLHVRERWGLRRAGGKESLALREGRRAEKMRRRGRGTTRSNRDTRTTSSGELRASEMVTEFASSTTQADLPPSAMKDYRPEVDEEIADLVSEGAQRELEEYPWAKMLFGQTLFPLAVRAPLFLMKKTVGIPRIAEESLRHSLHIANANIAARRESVQKTASTGDGLPDRERRKLLKARMRHEARLKMRRHLDSLLVHPYLAHAVARQSQLLRPQTLLGLGYHFYDVDFDQ
ncbi:unnamed protein product [Amoebophrya sp. A25]|nr:unnamed protein product [Amoebophrya sp. A25]|eukprot:GSA25T00009345001.1